MTRARLFGLRYRGPGQRTLGLLDDNAAIGGELKLLGQLLRASHRALLHRADRCHVDKSSGDLSLLFLERAWLGPEMFIAPMVYWRSRRGALGVLELEQVEQAGVLAGEAMRLRVPSWSASIRPTAGLAVISAALLVT